MNKYAKFAALMTVIIGTLIWLATASMQDTQTYYKTISELNQMPAGGKEKKCRVAGDVEKDSIMRKADLVEFTLVQDKLRLRVAYEGRDPLPDTFKDGAQALADGRLGADGVFRANKIQAKCSSKYAAKPGEAPAGLKPVVPANKSTI
jgi:cytochrome c-type biogenesis protein CcmE